MNPRGTVYIVDDQESIRSTIKGVLEDEQYVVHTFDCVENLWQGLMQQQPDLVLLDVWLPGTDGVEALHQMRADHPNLPVIMMSGHAGIDVAVKTMKAGAADFLEKPLNIDILLEKVALHLAREGGGPSAVKSVAGASAAQGQTGQHASLQLSQTTQKTVEKNAVMNGVGLLSGRPTGIIIAPAPVDTGIIFRTLDGEDIPGHITSLENFDRLEKGVGFTANSTVLTNGRRRIRTVEHLLAALHMLGITNAAIKVDEEIPNVDGSAEDFCAIIAAAGIVDQEKPRLDVVIHQKIAIGEETPDQKYIFVEPFDGFEIEMRVNYPAPIHEQRCRFNPTEHEFIADIAPARSFNTFENIDMAQQRGMAGSGYLNSHIIIHDGKVINTELKFADEFVRHKILDLLGDIYLLGYGLRGRIVANMTSHGLNQTLALKIHESLTLPMDNG